ncbi:AAA family ATPase [Streptomyces sp. NPDC003273]|uniref:AAA family ATPase n=1 Tax=Streptomyces sp. NPDC003273 TaxID=3364678 RepID=UPI003679F9E7
METHSRADWTSIAQIRIERLFGTYDYNIPLGDGPLDPKVFILYGDNGSGKTTILHTLHNLISPNPHRGHKSAVARVPFRSFSIDFSNGTTLAAKRRDNLMTGTFTLHLTHNGRKVSQRRFQTSEKGYVPVAETPEGEEAEAAFAQACTEFIGMESYLLTDDRQFDSDRITEAQDEAQRFLALEEFEDSHIPSLKEVKSQPRPPRIGFDQTPAHKLLLLALERFNAWARQRAVEGVSAGSVNANGVYLDLLNRLTGPRDKDNPEPEHRMAELENRIRVLTDMSARQALFGFDAQFPGVQFLDQLHSMPRSAHELAVIAFEPYLDGVEARLRTQEDTVKAISLFIDTLNEYLTDKSLSFRVGTGLRVRTPHRRQMPVHGLSSGERQLITLFCNIIAARTNSSIFIIDEPEISLNIKWQRRLVDSLLGCTANSGVQLAMASHSFELLSKHRESVTRLLMTEGDD